ncbi:MAG: HD domain-containing phosphohydrolase [Eubacteriales bacterium]
MPHRQNWRAGRGAAQKRQLTNQEYLQIQSHVAIGGYIQRTSSAIDKVSEGALYHHERYDGTGYMRGLKGEDIPIEARIICLGDAIDAMNSTRPYRERQSEAYIRSETCSIAGKQFDPVLVDADSTFDEGFLDEFQSRMQKIAQKVKFTSTEENHTNGSLFQWLLYIAACVPASMIVCDSKIRISFELLPMKSVNSPGSTTHATHLAERARSHPGLSENTSLRARPLNVTLERDETLRPV